VGSFERLGNLARNWESFGERQRTAKLLAFDQLHDDGVLFEAVDLGDVGMVERGQDSRFALKALHAGSVLGEGGRKDLDGDITIQLGIAGAVDFAHAASAD
jgi:hypothetical protein